MSTFVTRIAAVAAIALAALPVVAVSAAHAETRAAVIPVADLDFARPADVATFEKRIRVASSKLCPTRGGLRAAVACEKDVRQQAHAKLGHNQTSRMTAARAPARAYTTAAN